MGVTRDDVQKFLIFTLKTSYRSASDHPFILGMLLFSFFLYRCVPWLFFFLVSSSPVVICTAVLLGALLSYGNAYLPEIEEREEEEEKIRNTHHGVSSLRSGVVGNELVVEKDESFSVESYVGKSRDLGVSDLKEKKLIFEEENHEADDEEEDGSVSDETDGEVELGKEGHDEKLVIDGVHEKKPLIEEENDVAVAVQYVREKEIEGEEVDNFGSIQYSAISKGIDENGESSDYDSESDRAESSSPDASMADIMPMLDELHPLLDSEHFQPAPIPAEDDVASLDDDDASEESTESSDESEEDAEIAERGDDEEEEGKQGGRDDGTEAVVKWTQEDEKNLMDLGNSELERNRRLENLIARRRSRKNLRMMMTEKNLIDFDVGDHPFQMAPISTARRNPFDFHYDSNEGIDLPPIPGSAPSVLAPRRNPFDIPYDPLEERPNLVGGSFEEEIFTSLEKDTHFRRYESFSVGSSSLGESKQEKLHSKFRPYFVPEQLHSEELGHPTFQRQLSELSESKMSSVTEVDSVSSGSDQDDHKLMPHVEQEPSQTMHHLEHELSQPMHHIQHESSQPMTQEHSQPMPSVEHVPAEAVDLVESVQEYERVVVVDEVITHERESTSLETESIPSPVGSDITDVKEDILEEKHADMSSSSSSEVNESHFDAYRSEETEYANPEPDSVGVNNSTQPPGEDSNIRNAVEEGENIQIKEPVYDWNWSPSEVEKTLSGITIIEEALSFVDKKGVASTSLITSDTPVEALDVGLTPVQVERTISSSSEDSVLNNASIEEATTSGIEGLGTVSSHVDGIEENELVSEEVIAVIEHDVVDDGLSGKIHDDHTSQSDVKDPNVSAPYEDFMSPTESSECSSQNISEKQIAHSSSDGDRENSQEPSSPVPASTNEGDAIDDSWEMVHEDGGADSLMHSDPVSTSALIASATEPAPCELNYEVGLHDEIQNSRYAEDLMHSNVLATAGEVIDKEFNVGEEISEIDEELLTELDAVGDFSVKEEEGTTYQRENLSGSEPQESRVRPQAFVDHAHGADDIVEAVTGTRALESRFTSEGLSTVNEMEFQPRTFESEEGPHYVSPQLVESSMEDKLDFEKVMAGSVDEYSSKDEEVLESSSSSNTQKNVIPDAVGEDTLEARKTSTNQIENVSVVEVLGNLAGLRVHEDNSSIDVGENFHKTQDLVGAPANVRDLTSTEDVFFTPKLRETEVESEGVSGHISTGVFASIQSDKPDSEELVAEEAKASVKLQDSDDKESTVDSTNSIEDMETNKSKDDLMQTNLTGIQVLEDNSAEDTENDFHRIQDSPDVQVNPPSLEPRSAEEVHVTVKQLSLDTIEDELKPSEALDESDEIEAKYSHESEDSVQVPVHLQGLEPRTEGEVHVAAKKSSVDATEDELQPSECREELDEIEAKDILKSEDSSEVLHLQGLESRTEGEHVAAESPSVDARKDEQNTTDFVELHEIVAKVTKSSTEIKSDSEGIPTDVTETSVKESNFDVEAKHDASSTSTGVKKKKGSSKSSSSFSSSSSSSSSDSE